MNRIKRGKRDRQSVDKPKKYQTYIYIYNIYIVVPTQVEKMRAELASLNHCAVPFLSRAAVNLSWYDYIYETYSSFLIVYETYIYCTVNK